MDKNLCLPSGACSHRCNSGRDCEGSRRASCMALGLHRLVQVEERKSSPGKRFAVDGIVVFLLIAFGLALLCLLAPLFFVFK